MKTTILKGVRKAYQTVIPQPNYNWPWPKEGDWAITNKLLYDLLSQPEPCFIGRVGTVEGSIVLNRLTITPPDLLSRIKGCISYITTPDSRLPWWDIERPFMELQRNAGFFAERGISIELVERFADLYLRYIPQMDVCGRFAAYERHLPFSNKCKMVQLESLYPFFVEKPWMLALKGKKVLVVHPFKETIESQYKKREFLFANKDSLPEFNLKVIKAVQSIAGEKPPYKDWFEALEAMKEQIASTDFDVAILGCGAYGLPLAGFVKEELHKKAVHMGGGTQLLFGIKGRRWIKDYANPCYRDMFNEYWVFPSEAERPSKSAVVEGGCYW